MDQISRRTALALAGAAMLIPALPDSAHAFSIDLQRLSTYLTEQRTLKGKFVQIAPDGLISDGTFYLRRPGRMRFEFTPPAPVRVIADGTWVIVEDLQLDKVDRYPLSQTPLGLILKDKVDLNQSDMVQNLEKADGILRVTAHDPDDPGKGNIILVFQDEPLALKQWVVTDAQGLRTTVTLTNVEINGPVDPALFHVSDFAD